MSSRRFPLLWPNGATARRAKHKGYGWGDLYKNADGTHMLRKNSNRMFLVRDLSEIVQWDDNSGAVQEWKGNQ